MTVILIAALIGLSIFFGGAIDYEYIEDGVLILLGCVGIVFVWSNAEEKNHRQNEGRNYPYEKNPPNADGDFRPKE